MKKTPQNIFILGSLVVCLWAGSILNLGATGKITNRWKGWTFHIMAGDPVSKAKELHTMRILKELIKKYELSPWIRTREITIQNGARARSNPLTLHTGYNNDSDSLLATFLHEQIHKLETIKPRAFSKATIHLKRLFPTLPPPHTAEPKKTHRHFIVCFYEVKALRRLIGRSRAASVIGRKIRNNWIYQEIFNNWTTLGEIYRRHNLNIFH